MTITYRRENELWFFGAQPLDEISPRASHPAALTETDVGATQRERRRPRKKTAFTSVAGAHCCEIIFASMPILGP
jgi:hypothetical protein